MSIHSTAVISPEAVIAENVKIGPFCVIGRGVTIAEGCELKSHVVIGSEDEAIIEIGKNNLFYPFTSIGERTQDLKYSVEPTGLKIGDNNTFREYVSVHRSTAVHEFTIIGNNNLILASVHIGHDCILHDHVIISSNSGIAGHVEIFNHAIVAGCVGIHQFCRIGAHSMVGGMSQVIKDIPPFMLVEGQPAKVRGINQVGLTRHGFLEDDLRALKNVYKALYLKKDANFSVSVEKFKDSQTSINPKVQLLLDYYAESQRGVCR